MKATGITRRVDELGRIVLPIELRRTMDIEERDLLEIYTEGNRIILEKFEQKSIDIISIKDEYNEYLSKNGIESSGISMFHFLQETGRLKGA